MEIILLADVSNLGDKDDIVKVRNGYANNYLIPQKLAIVATAANKKIVAENQRQAAHRQAKIREAAQAQADLISSLSIQIPALVGKEGKLYGAVTPLQIAQVLKDKGFEIDRRKISFAEEIKTTGEFTAIVNLHKEVKVELRFEVIEKVD